MSLSSFLSGYRILKIETNYPISKNNVVFQTVSERLSDFFDGLNKINNMLEEIFVYDYIPL